MTQQDAAQFFEKAPSPLIAVDTTTLRVVASNEKAARLFGRPTGQETALSEIFPREELQRISDVLLNQVNDAEILNSRVRDAGGDFREIDLLIGATDTTNVVLVSLLDASARGRLEEQLRQAQRTEALGMLAGGIAHDFNNLLTIISGYTQMLQTSAPGTERDRTAIEQVLKACDHAAGLTSQLLAFSRRQAIQLRILDLNELVDQTAGMMRRLIGEDIDLRIRHNSGAGSVYADPGQLQQVILNLAINARDAMPNGGSLTIHTKGVELGSDYIGRHFGIKPGRYSLLEVSDTGTGMDEATRKRVLEPFFTTKPEGKGTGLGLATVDGIVRQFGGSIDICSELGHGTTFRVYLPQAQDSAEPKDALHEEEGAGHETLLLVEDEEGVRKIARIALERRGYTVLVAASGPEAIEVARTYEGVIDLLVTDMVMPKMYGHELARRLTDERPSLVTIFMSGYPGDNFGTSGLDLEGCFLQKPFAPRMLLNKVREVLDRAKTRRSSGRPQ